MGLFTSNQTHRIFKNKAIRTWNLQPDSGNIPIANGPRPKDSYWARRVSSQGMLQYFMSLTLSAFYKRQVPPWAIQDWDVKLIINGSITIEKRNFIQTFINPNI